MIKYIGHKHGDKTAYVMMMPRHGLLWIDENPRVEIRALPGEPFVWFCRYHPRTCNGPGCPYFVAAYLQMGGGWCGCERPMPMDDAPAGVLSSWTASPGAEPPGHRCTGQEHQLIDQMPPQLDGVGGGHAVQAVHLPGQADRQPDGQAEQ